MVESKSSWKAWLYLSPALVLLLIFTVWPIINTVRMAFLENYSGLEAIGGRSFSIGIANFTKVISYKKFLDCLKTTVLLCVITVPVSSILALLIAVCLNSIKPLSRMLQTIFFLPYVTNSIAIGMVFAAMFNIIGNNIGSENEIITTAGIINNIIEFFGGHAVNWINAGSTYAANMTVMIIYIVYDNPVNLFVAKFLGTPPINVFNGKVLNNELYIGEEKVLKVENVADQEVIVGIRPEGFILDKLQESEKVRFSLKPNKVFIFSKETEKRLF